MSQPADNLFTPANQQALFQNTPLSVRMRPQILDEYVGQKHILAPGKLLSRAIASDRLTSVVLYGPPGCGKTRR